MLIIGLARGGAAGDGATLDLRGLYLKREGYKRKGRERGSHTPTVVSPEQRPLAHAVLERVRRRTQD